MSGLAGLQVFVPGRNQRRGSGRKTPFADGFQQPFLAAVTHAHPCTNFVARTKASGAVASGGVKNANANAGGFDRHDFPNLVTGLIACIENTKPARIKRVIIRRAYLCVVIWWG